MSLPTIDIGAWRSGDDDRRAAIATEVDEALRTSGFLMVTNHGVSMTLASAVREQAQRFFALDAEQKSKLQARVGQRGWIPPGAESNAYASGEESPPDMKETLKLGYHSDDSPMANRWPEEVPTLRATAETYLAEIWQLALSCFDLFNDALGLAPGRLRQDASAEESSLNLNWYPSLETVGTPRPGQFRIGPHSDFGALTLLDRQVGYGGLQLQSTEGTWVDAPHVEGALTVNVGDLLARWTGDRWRSTVHRVLPPSEQAPGEQLLSLVTFCGIAPDVLVETLDVDGPTTYEPVLAGDYLRAKIQAIDTM